MVENDDRRPIQKRSFDHQYLASSEHTKQKAIVKLNKLGIHFGYPDKIPATL